MKTIELESLKTKRAELQKAIELAVKRHKPRKALRKELRKIIWAIFHAEGGATKALNRSAYRLRDIFNVETPILKMIKNRGV